jgi:hypothetical protein
VEDADTGALPPNPVGTSAQTWGSVPSTSTSLPPAPTPTRTRDPLALVGVVVVLVVLAVAGITLLGGHGGRSFPETLGGQPRATGDLADRVEKALGDYEMQGMTVDVALYGPEQEPSGMIMIIKGAPDALRNMSRDEFFDTFSTGFASGFAGASGQQVDFTNGLKETRGSARLPLRRELGDRRRDGVRCRLRVPGRGPRRVVYVLDERRPCRSGSR